jgi:hypothetical protein
MQACTSISKIILILLMALSTVNASAQTEEPPAAAATPPKKEEPGLFDQSTPYLEYGDFNMNDEEDADTLYFQYGRFFGLSLGLGYQAATGNRGLLYTPAFPRFDLKVHYWFDFQTAMNIDIAYASHTYDLNGTNNVRLMSYGVSLKYSFDVRNAAAPIAFSNPFLIAGVGAISKTETTITTSTIDSDSTFSVNFGAGLEFPITHKRTYFILDGRYHTQNFLDTNDTVFNTKGLPDLSGGFFSITGSILFAW